MTASMMKRADQVIAATYSRFPIVITKGAGSTVWDSEGRAYTDFVSGIAVCNLGHAHPGVAKALATQAEKLLHVSNLYYTEPQIDLAEWLVEHSFADRVFFGNSGAEANEAAIKLARKYAKENHGEACYRIIAMEQSFHGRTMATLSATGQKKIRQGYDPTLDGFEFVPFGDIGTLEAKIGESTCAVLLEPIQGEGGIVCPSTDYLKAVRRLCDDTNALMILDEIQTGIGRTGKLFAYEHFDVAPDIMTLAKALANGLPIGAMLATEKVASAFGPGAHASTFGGTPIVTAAALEVLRTIETEGIVSRCLEMGRYFGDALSGLMHKYAVIEDVRGMGLLLGIGLGIEGAPFVAKCMERGFLINCIQDSVLRFIPPLTVTKKEIDALVTCLDELFDEQQSSTA